MSKTRTFVAVAASPELRSHAKQAIAQLRSTTDRVKWVAPENLHWTLQFLGDVEDIELAAVCRKVAQVAEQHEPFPLVAQGVDAFPKVDRPRAVWIGAEQGADALFNLQDAIEDALADLGFRGERRRYVPHLTLGRVRQGSHGGEQLSEQIRTMSDFEAGEMFVDQVTGLRQRVGTRGTNLSCTFAGTTGWPRVAPRYFGKE